MAETRQVKVFDWSTVEPALVRSMLQAAYLEFGPKDEAGKVADLDDHAARLNAESAMGRPPEARFKGNKTGVSRVLLEEWLPQADDDSLAELAGLANKYDKLSTRKQRLEFLAARRRTEAFVEILWKVFLAAHKTARTVEVRNRAEERERSSRFQLVGRGAERRYAEPYPHQEHAWGELDQLRDGAGRRSGLIVIPTGGGKTATMVGWLIGEMSRRPNLRVLWIADQQELVDQAAREFTVLAAEQADGFTRLLRAVHGQAGSVSALADVSTHVVCTTRQSLVGKSFEAKSATIKSFLTGPTVVVVDEAHHAVAPMYQKLIEFLWGEATDMMLLGLTATPWPSGAGRTKLLRETFKTEVVSVTTQQLVERGDLARPVLHTVTTSEPIEVTDQDLKQLESGIELPASIIRQINRGGRNRIVVDKWLERKAEWGKTLVFACDIQHADSLGAAFRDAGVDADVLHSAAEVDRGDVLLAFRAAVGPRVLVSVGMLLEGVDIPSARTAFVCRPTTSHIVMRQMIGRVLRGVRAGGEAEAHVVDFVDKWSQHVAILSPVDIPDVPLRQTRTGEAEGERPLPPILTDEGIEIGEDLIRRIAATMEERVRLDGLTATLTGSRLIGFYDLDVRRIPVFAHADEAWQDLAAWATDPANKQGTRASAFFDDVPPPAPLGDEIAAFVDYCKSNGGAPPLQPLSATVDIALTVRKLRDADPMSADEEIEFLRAEYESTLARCMYPTLQSFLEAVRQEHLAQLELLRGGARPETIPTPRQRPDETLRKQPARDLRELFEATVAKGMELLAPEPAYDGWLHHDHLPGIGWTRRPTTSMWGYWSWRKGTRAKGKPVIRINLALQAPKTQVSDDLLMYLIWHELCHHLTPARGHDAEFRRLEALWPDQPRLDHELDTLHERYDIPRAPAQR